MSKQESRTNLAASSHSIDNALGLQMENDLDPNPDFTQYVLKNNWHEYSDSQIHSTLKNFQGSTTSSNETAHSYHPTIRILSAALSKLSDSRAQLERDRKLLEEKERLRRERADALVDEMRPADQQIARRLLTALFPDSEKVSQLSMQPDHMVLSPLLFHRWNVTFQISSRYQSR